MTFTEMAKNEILLKNFEQTCCNVSSLAGFLRGAGTLAVNGSHLGVEVVSENKFSVDKFSQIIKNIYGLEISVTSYKDKLTSKQKYKMKCVENGSIEMLKELGIIASKDGSTYVNFSIDKYLIENECCKRAYLIGSFIGSGSVVVPKNDKKNSGYHLEFVFSNYQTADDFSCLMAELGFIPKLTIRKENYVVYFKNGDEISDILAFMGATKSCLEVKEIIIEKDLRNDTNRKVNCEMGNLNKQVEASLKQIKAINLIDETIGLDSLPSQLKQTAIIRRDNPDSTLEETAEIMGITKSCLNHRLRKLTEIAKNL